MTLLDLRNIVKHFGTIHGNRGRFPGKHRNGSAQINMLAEIIIYGLCSVAPACPVICPGCRFEEIIVTLQQAQ